MRNLFFLILCFLWAGIANAQQNVGFRKGNIQSPEINPDHSVTFRLQADKAKQVLVLGDWEANEGKGLKVAKCASYLLSRTHYC